VNYLEACEAIVTRREAQREIERHGMDWADLVADLGDRPEYSGSEILNWLGY